MIKNTKILFLSLAIAIILTSFSFATVANATILPQEFACEISSPSAVLIDANTGTVLYEKNAKEKKPVASMVKIMTLLLAFEEIEKGGLSFDENVIVSENASSMGGSQAFLDSHAEYKVTELLKAIVVASANDACVAIAERISGSVEGFVAKMNEKAKSLLMENTNFVNCTGLPMTNQYSCAYDASIMFRELIKHEDYYNYSKIFTFDFQHPSGRKTMLTNTNKLVRAYEGCDGGKTGFTNEAMYCLSATAKRNGTRLISVITGAETSKKRNAEICKLFDYGFANYETKQVVFKNIDCEEKLFVPNSREKFATIKPKEDGFLLFRKGEDKTVSTKIEFCENIKLPVCSGETVGKIKVLSGDKTVFECELLASSDLNERGYMDVLGEMIEKW
ncbi:MAG: D-alanyl-D-alanine carboxypeptidase [Clostridia bacterium]|nr:D-alanyl-D-alanine carboxypeptidase [Clostridia bacterium]